MRCWRRGPRNADVASCTELGAGSRQACGVGPGTRRTRCLPNDRSENKRHTHHKLATERELAAECSMLGHPISPSLPLHSTCQRNTRRLHHAGRHPRPLVCCRIHLARLLAQPSPLDSTRWSCRRAAQTRGSMTHGPEVHCDAISTSSHAHNQTYVCSGVCSAWWAEVPCRARCRTGRCVGTRLRPEPTSIARTRASRGRQPWARPEPAWGTWCSACGRWQGKCVTIQAHRTSVAHAPSRQGVMARWTLSCCGAGGPCWTRVPGDARSLTRRR